MNYHVFIVDDNTFKYHLEYGFAGIGASDKESPFLLDHKTSNIHSTTERNLVSMIADISRIRIGDKIVFYLQASQNRQGMFFGVFRATSNAFFDENNDANYLKYKMNKGLSFRVLIKTDEVYSFGITEHEYLDSLEDKEYPYQMCWSLIYRKLKGARGCTMITQREYLDLLSKLKKKNANKQLTGGLSYDSALSCIVNEKHNAYKGRKNSVDILPRLLYKAGRGNAFEAHLQAYILQNFDKEPLKSLLLLFPNKDVWVGNEVSCGVGMQRIDLMLIQNLDRDVYIKIIELKYIKPYPEIITNQIPWYIQWVTEYIVPSYLEQGKKVHLIPCVIAKNSNNKNYFSEVKKFNSELRHMDNFEISAIQNLAFDVNDTDIVFQLKDIEKLK